MEMEVECIRLNGSPLEEVDCIKYLGSQGAADGGCERNVVHRMNEGYRAWEVLKSVLNNRGLGINTKKRRYEEVITPTRCVEQKHGVCEVLRERT